MPKRKSGKRPHVLLIHNVDKTWTPAEKRNATREIKTIESAIRSRRYKVINIPIRNTDIYSILSKYDPETHVIFNCCESLPGINHSESRVTAILESLHFSYTGSDTKTLDLCWDKKKTKILLDRNKVSTPRWRIYESPQLIFDDWNFYPSIAKPTREHCSLGVTTEAVVLTKAELRKRISFVLNSFSQPALVEDFIDGREFHITLWGNDSVKMLPPAEMDFSAFENIHDRLCTYDSKFDPDSIHYKKIKLKLPAELSKKEYNTLRGVAKKAYSVLGCRDYARIDIRLRNGVFYVLDINANPDISRETSMAYAAELAGYSYNAMIGNILSLAVKRHRTMKSSVKKKTKARIKKGSYYECDLLNFE